jgi:hypothetical protein
LNNIQLHGSNEYLCEYNISIKENMLISGLILANVIFASMLAPYPTDLSMREHRR